MSLSGSETEPELSGGDSSSDDEVSVKETVELVQPGYAQCSLLFYLLTDPPERAEDVIKDIRQALMGWKGDEPDEEGKYHFIKIAKKHRVFMFPSARNLQKTSNPALVVCVQGARPMHVARFADQCLRAGGSNFAKYAKTFVGMCPIHMSGDRDSNKPDTHWINVAGEEPRCYWMDEDIDDNMFQVLPVKNILNVHSDYEYDIQVMARSFYRRSFGLFFGDS